jgi:AbrB family looped-hinge helix DNA binding protein
MSGTYQVVMGDRGRLVIPVEVREHLGLETGTPLVLVESDHGMLLVTRDQLKRLVRAELGGADLVAELIAERRRLAAAEDAA